jgi:hypothetical protein
LGSKAYWVWPSPALAGRWPWGWPVRHGGNRARASHAWRHALPLPSMGWEPGLGRA